MSWFQKDGKGRYISGPGTSPENVFRVQDETGKKISLSVSNGCSHDLLLGREALRNYIAACRELGINTPVLAKARQFLPRMWRHLNANLEQSALAPVARWFDRHVPAEVRA